MGIIFKWAKRVVLVAVVEVSYWGAFGVSGRTGVQ